MNNNEERKELIRAYKEFIKARAQLRLQIDCIDIDIREVERELSSYPMEPRCW